MSRQGGAGRTFATTSVVLSACAIGSPLAAQDPAPFLTAEDVLDQARAAYSDPAIAERRARTLRKACPPPTSDGVIVVCAREPDEPESAGYDKARAERDYAARTADKGNPRAPDLGPGECVPSLLTYCGTGGPLPRPILIDLAAIPEAGDDADAARIGRGEKAR